MKIERFGMILGIGHAKGQRNPARVGVAMQARLKRRSECGLGKFSAIFLVSIFGITAFLGYNIFPFYYYYFELQSHMDTVIRMAGTLTQKEIRKRLWDQIKWMEIPVEPKDLKIAKDGEVLKISLEYTEVFYITWQEKDHVIHTFHFHVYTEGKIL